MHCGQRAYEYIKSFLDNRTATIGIGSTCSDVLQTPKRGMPQGSILSPVLFSIGMKGLAVKLKRIPNLGHAVCADDVTLWTAKGSLGDRQETLQKAISVVEDLVAKAGMICAPEKSELIRIRAAYTRKDDRPPINLALGGQTIQEVSKARILGLWIEGNGAVGHAIANLRKPVNSVSRMINREARNRKGFKEEQTIRLVQAFIISRITFGHPFQKLSRSEEAQINALIRRAYKAALACRFAL